MSTKRSTGVFTITTLRDGADGYSSAVVQLYRRSATPLGDNDRPDGTLTYTFADGILRNSQGQTSGTGFNGWSQSIPDVSGNDGTKLFVTMATASSQGATDDIIVDASATPPVNEWSTPVEYVADGMAYATITIYKRSASQPGSSDKPDDNARYYFKTVGSGSSQIKAYTLVAPSGGSLHDWSTDIPSTNANHDPCWVRRATAVAKNTDDYDAIGVGEWSDPAAKLVEDGEDGNGIVSITRTWAISAKSAPEQGHQYPADIDSSVPAGTDPWSADSPPVTAQKPYLWTKEEVVFTDMTKNTTKYYCIGARGDNGIDAQDVEWVYVRTTTNTPPTIVAGSGTDYWKQDDFKPLAQVSSGRIKGYDDTVADANIPVQCTDDPKGVDETWQFEWEMKRTKGAAVNGHREWNNYTTGSAMTLHNNFAASAFIIDLDNDNDQFGADSESKVQATQERSTKVTLYDGATPQTLKTDGGLSVSLTYDDDTSVPNSVATYIATPSTGEVKVSILKNTNTEFSHDAIKALITATDTNNRSKSAVFTIRKILSGQPGLSPVIYQLNPTNKDFVFNRDASNNLIPASRLTTVNAIRTEGDSRRNASTSGDGVTYSWGFDNEAATQAHSGRSLGTSIEVSNTDANSHYQVWVELSTGDRETLPIVKDGTSAAQVNPNILVDTLEYRNDQNQWFSLNSDAESELYQGRIVRKNKVGTVGYDIRMAEQVIANDTVVKLSPNTWYTFSVYVKGGTDSYYTSLPTYALLILQGKYNISTIKKEDGTTENVPSGTGDVAVGGTSTSSWERHWFSFKTKSSIYTGSENYYMYVSLRLTSFASGQSLYMSMPKLEVGDTATAYMPNEDDLKSSGVQYITVKGACKVGNSNPNDGQITICNGKDAPVTLTQDNMSPDSSSDNRRRGLALVTVDRYQMKVTNNDVKQFYDTCVSDRCTALANYINNYIGTNKFICLFSYDAIGWNDALINALKACGSSGIEHTETARRPFAFIGYKGLEQGYAMQLFGDVESNSTADVTAYIADGVMSTSKDGQNAPYDIAWYARYTTRDANSQTGAPTGDSDTGWQSTAPAPTYSYPYIWQKIQHYNSSGQAEGSPSYTCLTGADGPEGQPGQRGLTGRMYYIAGKWNETTQYSRTTDLCPVVYYKVGSGSSMIEWWYLTENNSTGDQPYDGSSKWAKVENFGVVLTEAIFVKEFAQFGACIITGDWLISIHGKLNNQSYAGTVENPETYNGLPAYTYFDPVFPIGGDVPQNLLTKNYIVQNVLKRVYGKFNGKSETCKSVDYEGFTDVFGVRRYNTYTFNVTFKVNIVDYRGYVRIMGGSMSYVNRAVNTDSISLTEESNNTGGAFSSNEQCYFAALLEYKGGFSSYTSVYTYSESNHADDETIQRNYERSYLVPFYQWAYSKPNAPTNTGADQTSPNNDWSVEFGSGYSGQTLYICFGTKYNTATPVLTVASIVLSTDYNYDRFIPNYAVDLKTGRSYQNDAYVRGTIEAADGKIGGFTIDTDRLYNSDWNAGIDIAYDNGKNVKIGKNAKGVMDTEDTIIRAENTKVLGGTYNTALYLNASGATYNYAFYGNGNGVLNGLVCGYKVQLHTIPSGNTDAVTYLSINHGSTIILNGSHSNGNVWIAAPKLSDVRKCLGINSSTTPFAIEFTVVSHANYEFVSIAFRNAITGTQNSEYPWLMDTDDRHDSSSIIPVQKSIQIAQGDVVKILLLYDNVGTTSSPNYEYRAYDLIRRV